MKNNFEKRLLRLVAKINKNEPCKYCGFRPDDMRPVFMSELPPGSEPPGKCEYCGHAPPVFLRPDGTLPDNGSA